MLELPPAFSQSQFNQVWEQKGIHCAPNTYFGEEEEEDFSPAFATLYKYNELTCEKCQYHHSPEATDFRSFWVCGSHQVPSTKLEASSNDDGEPSFTLAHCRMTVCDKCYVPDPEHLLVQIKGDKCSECSALAVDVVDDQPYCSSHKPTTTGHTIYSAKDVESVLPPGFFQDWYAFMYTEQEEDSVYWLVNRNTSSPLYGYVCYYEHQGGVEYLCSWNEFVADLGTNIWKYAPASSEEQ